MGGAISGGSEGARGNNGGGTRGVVSSTGVARRDAVQVEAKFALLTAGDQKSKGDDIRRVEPTGFREQLAASPQPKVVDGELQALPPAGSGLDGVAKACAVGDVRGSDGDVVVVTVAV